MSTNYVISTCSTADLTKEHFTERDIKYVCFHYFLDGKEYTDDLGESLSFEDFYAALGKKAKTKTSQVNADEFIDFFTPFLENGQDIIHICLSAGLSGVYNSANIAADELREKYPERKIYIVNSLAASSGLGLFVDMLADLRDEGKTIDEVYKWAEANKLRIQHWFFSTDLTYFVLGGRISKVSGFLGTALKICPLLNVSNEGKLVAREKIRTKQAVIKQIVSKMEANADGGLSYDGKCYISNSACREDAEAVAALIESKFPALKGKVRINSIGTTIGSHTGVGTVALFFVGNERKN